MGEARHPKPYNEGPRRQVTVPWKQRVLAKLAENKKAGKKPANREQLKDEVGAPKNSINQLLNLKKKTPQLTSTYADAINAVLKIEPPLIEQEGDDDEFIRDVAFLRMLSPSQRRDVIVALRRLVEKP